MDYYKELRREVSELVLSNTFSKKITQLRFFNDPIIKLVEILNNSYKNAETKEDEQKILAPFQPEGVIRKAIISPEEVEKGDSTKHYFSKSQNVIDFAFMGKDPNDGRIDSFAIMLGYDSYIDFCLKKGKKQKEDEEEQLENESLKNDKNEQVDLINCETDSSTSNLLENQDLKEFFKHQCYLYVYDEDLTKPHKNTGYLDYHYPNIDALVLDYCPKKNRFTLENPKNSLGEKRETHKEGVFSWCNDKNGKKKNAFDITFGISRTQLVLRLYFQCTEEYENREISVLVGAFLFCNDTASSQVATGSIVLEKKYRREELIPYQFEFIKGTKNPQPHPPPYVQRYLLDRYANWHKTPLTIYNKASFESWLFKKYGNEYTGEDIDLKDFVISHPSNGLSEKDRDHLKNEIIEIINNPRKQLRKFSQKVSEINKSIGTNRYRVKEKDAELLSKFISKKNRDNKIIVYPNPSTSRIYLDYINQQFLEHIKKAVNMIFIIPDKEYTKVSSIFIVIGYCIALKKRTFVFFQKGNENERPDLLKNPEIGVGLYVYEYDEIYEIPYLLVSNFFRNGWEKLKREREQLKDSKKLKRQERLD